MAFLAECAVLGTATIPEVIRERDPDVLLTLSAVNRKMVEMRDDERKRLAQHIIAELAKAWSK